MSAPTQLSEAKTCSQAERVVRKDFVNLEEGGSEWVWVQGGDLGVGLERGVGLGPEGVG